MKEEAEVLRLSTGTVREYVQCGEIESDMYLANSAAAIAFSYSRNLV
jgi:hypothetical protein